MSLDWSQLWDLLAQLSGFLQQFSSMSGMLGSFIQTAWTTLLGYLPASTVMWFMLAVLTTVAYGVATLSVKLCEVFMIVFWILFLILFVLAELHLSP